MKLTKVRLTNYRSIDDSTEFETEPDVTCLVGKNESGKTAVLQALLRLNPEQGVEFDVTRDYPRVGLNKYQRQHDQNPATVVTARFLLDANEVLGLETEFGAGIVKPKKVENEQQYEVVATKGYDNRLSLVLDLDESAFVRHWLASQPDVPNVTLKAMKGVTSTEGLLDKLDGLESSDEDKVAVEQFREAARADLVRPLCERVQAFLVKHYLPTFMYFGEYDIMCGAADLAVLRTSEKSTDPGHRTLYALLELASITPGELDPASGSYEDHKARLESTANSITDEVFKYWTQNRELEVEFDVAPLGPKDPKYRPPTQGQPAASWFQVRIKNRRHRVTVPFNERSKGFVWFFSFLARFNQIADTQQPLILLLDEPGLSLHGTAQADFLRFINERLADGGYQVLYTTHSPFMVEPERLHRVRAVDDEDQKGTVLSADWLRADRSTAFPLLAKLGIDLAQGLCVGPNNLLVEGPSDLHFLQAMSELVESNGKPGLSRRWVILPVNGADRLPFFAAHLRSNSLHVAVLMDTDGQHRQRFDKLTKDGVLDPAKVIQVREFAKAKTQCDTEDLFDVRLYLALVSQAYSISPALTEADLPKGDRITKRVEQVFKARGRDDWNHYRPAKYLARNPFAVSIPDKTLGRFIQLFEKMNSLLPGD